MRSLTRGTRVVLAALACLTIGIDAQLLGQGTAQAPATPTLQQAIDRMNAGDCSAAASIAEGLVSKEPKNARAWRVLGFCSIKTGQTARAIAAYTTSLEIEPTFASAMYNLGAAYALAGDKDEAFRWLGKARATTQLDMTQVTTDADLSSLKGDPRLDALLPKPEDFANPFVEPTAILREWDGEGANDQFGWIARSAGDVDGDGVPDVVTSAPTRGIAGQPPSGRVYVYSTKSSKLLWKADGAPGDMLGIGLESAGDVNHDGIPDVIASAPGGGYAKVFSGRDGRVLLTLHAEAPGDLFGRHVSGVGDINGDGYDDVIVGAPGNSAAGPGAGRAYVFSGRDGSVLLTLTGEHAGDAFGASVAGSTENGRTTLIVGAPTAGPSKHGRAYVYDGRATSPRFVVEGDETGVGFGAMFVSVPGDMDRDGTPDLFVADWQNRAKGPITGRIYVYSGKDGHRLFTLTGETAGSGFGDGPSAAGDVDGDGYPDLIIGAWQFAGAAVSGGRAYLYSGRDGHLMKTFTCRIPGDTFGFDSVGIGDIDHDGTVDFLISSGNSGVHGFHSGRVFIISSGVRPSAKR